MRFAKPTLIAFALTGATLGMALSAAPASAGPDATAMAQASVRSPIAADRFYFVMTDRYRNGDPSNDTGGIAGTMEATGFEPSSESFYHGGDLAGLTGNCNVDDPHDDGLARIKRLGFTAVWITPPFVNRPVQGDSASYHGYWFLDLSKPDPHLGTEAEFAAFMGCAKRLGIKVFLDVVVNHTADAISYKQGNAYVSIAKRPYRMANGKAFDPYAWAHGMRFPQLSPTRSFAKTPSVDPAFAGAKYPAVLNEVVRYHNRGDIAFGSCVGRCETDGDFYGLDDLMTEDYRVVEALGQAYGDWITKYGVDGFRIDTAKHVDPYFFGRWLPMIQSAANAATKPGFTTFAEAWLTDSAQLSEFQRTRGLPSVLDFPFQETVTKFAQGKSGGAALSLLFGDDDYYTTATTNAYGLTTFLGNHDMGRIGFFLKTGSTATGQALVERDQLAHDVLYLTRGVPVVYYGDEVGMTGGGDGKDKQARQDMFPTQVLDWRTQDRVGTAPIGAGSSFDESTALEAHLRALADVRTQHPALATGAMLPRLGSGSVFAASRIDAAARAEYVVAFNAGDSVAAVTVPTSTPSSNWSAVLGGVRGTTGADGKLGVTIPARSAVVLRADSPLPTPGAPSIALKTTQDAATGAYLLAASVPGADPSTVTFVAKRAGSADWTALGSDDSRPFRYYLPTGQGRLQIAAVVRDTAGQTTATAPLSLATRPFQ